jgi:LysM repeat protein
MVKRCGVFVVLVLVLTLVSVMPAAAQGTSSLASQAAAAPAADTYYIVQRGDTLARIAARFGTTVTAILRANPQIVNPNRIYAGQRLLIPGAPAPIPAITRINFASGATSASVNGTAPANNSAHYVVHVNAGQWLLVDAFPTSGSAILIIWGRNGDVLISDHAGATNFRGQVPTTQDYFIDVRAVNGAAAHFNLQVIIPARISFAAGATSKTVTGTAARFVTRNYVAGARAGQTMTVATSATTGQVILVIYGSDGNVLISDHAGATTWTGVLPTTEDYFIDVHSVGSTTAHYSLTLTIR